MMHLLIRFQVTSHSRLPIAPEEPPESVSSKLSRLRVNFGSTSDYDNVSRVSMSTIMQSSNLKLLLLRYIYVNKAKQHPASGDVNMPSSRMFLPPILAQSN